VLSYFAWYYGVHPAKIALSANVTESNAMMATPVAQNYLLILVTTHLIWWKDLAAKIVLLLANVA
jgi:hypothetical protein